MRGPKSIEVKLDLKFFSIGGTWEPNDVERKAAWEMYVELCTRISVVPLRDGIAREALTSLYSLFGQSREILRRYGPDLAQPRRDGEYNLGFLTVAMLNLVLRPVLSQWHPELQVWESERAATSSVKAHEDAWPRIGELRSALEQTRLVLVTYAGLLAKACGVPDLSAQINSIITAQGQLPPV
ncbi:MAG TPA: hypothetical protein VI248_28400 [Kineosporiaceae bacterium]